MYIGWIIFILESDVKSKKCQVCWVDMILVVVDMLELCAQNRNPEGVTEDPKDQVISISGGRSFAFSFSDTLELHWT